MEEELKEIKRILLEMQKTQEFHGKILIGLAESVDAKRHDQARMVKSAADLIRKAGMGIPDSPFASVLKETANAVEGKHGD